MNFNIIKLKLLIVIGRLAILLKLPLPPIPSACAIIEKNGKILAIDLSYRKGYSLPGGGLSYFETLEEGVIREIKEETNLEVSALKYLTSHKHISEGGLSHVSVCFKVKVKTLATLKSSGEGKTVWLTPQALYKNCAYKDVKRHLKDYYNF